MKKEKVVEAEVETPVMEEERSFVPACTNCGDSGLECYMCGAGRGASDLE